MSLVPTVILAAIGALLAVTLYLAYQYVQSTRRAAAELGWRRALLAAIGNVVVLLVLLWLVSVAGLVGVQATGWIGQMLGLTESAMGILIIGSLVVAAVGVTLVVALLYDRLFPEITRSFQ